jgi:hypothetical protein
VKSFRLREKLMFSLTVFFVVEITILYLNKIVRKQLAKLFQTNSIKIHNFFKNIFTGGFQKMSCFGANILNFSLAFL